MVDVIVSYVAQKLADYLIQEAASLQGVKAEVEWFRKELGIMQCFLRDAEEKQGNDLFCEWVLDIRDIAYDIEDVIGTFLLEVEEGRTSGEGLVASVIVEGEAYLYDINNKIKELRDRVLDISRKRDLYGIKSIGDAGQTVGAAIERLRQLRRATYVDEEHIVGFEDDTCLLLAELTKDELQNCVISILGMGGLGKTTLARKLYNNSTVQTAFDCRAWVCVSQDYRIQDLLREIIRLVTKERVMSEMMTVEDLEQYLCKLLEKQKYLVVIDDLWHKEAWESLRRAFPDNRKQSKVIITTRNKAVAQCANWRTYVHKLRFLQPHESWELFCRRTFPRSNVAVGDANNCPSSLEMLGREMVGKCGGLPLAIVVLGGLLSRKQPNEWQEVYDHIWQHFKNASIHMSHMLALSFKDMPYQLQLCFLYLALFPEDSEIDAQKVIKLWVAEGFIPREEATLEEVAEKYLDELIDRSLIQVSKRNWRQITAFKVHNLLRDLAVDKAKELNFFHIYNGNTNSVASSTATSYRRQASHSGFKRYASLRTLMFFNSHFEKPRVEELTIIPKRFRMLRVLDLEGVQFDRSCDQRLPDAIGKLIHLKYLGLKDTSIRELPECIGDLQALETLYASRGDSKVIPPYYIGELKHLRHLPSQCMGNLLSLKTLYASPSRSNSIAIPPDEIRKLKRLRHLIGSFESPLPVENLTSLQTLKFLEVSHWTNINPTNLINLRELRLINYRSNSQVKFTFASISRLTNLQFLTVLLDSGKRVPSLQPLSQCPHLLELRIMGKMESLPGEMHQFLVNLKYMELHVYSLKQDPLPVLEKLPSLMILDLRAYGDQRLIFSAKRFPQLEVLKLKVSPWPEWRVEEGAMPMLKALGIKHGSFLTIPERWKSIPNIHSLGWEWKDLD